MFSFYAVIGASQERTVTTVNSSMSIELYGWHCGYTDSKNRLLNSVDVIIKYFAIL
jgi:hypothetical protein